ncbi:MAG: Hsp20/alpha crystallin family protein [Myxococcota bacterium]
MRLIRRSPYWDPIQEMEAFTNRMSRLFGQHQLQPNEDRELMAGTDWSPSCDISETDKTYEIQAELPGVKKENVNVALEDGVLRISGERKEEKEETKAKIHRRELFHGSFARSFTMPSDADQEHIKASFKDGILHVQIGKSKSKASKSVQINVS